MTTADPALTKAPDTAIRPGQAWLRRFAFRSVALYLVLYNTDWALTLLPGLGWAERAWGNLWRILVPWVGRTVIRVPYPIATAQTGSLDKAFDYVQLVCFVVLALLGALLWVWFDRDRSHDAVINEAIRALVRYVLAASMFTYGFSKVFHLQMPAPGPGRLMEPYGDSSPMGLLWTFMGCSAAYSFFAGAAEVTGGVLVLFRRTTTLGGLVIMAVMSNVVAMNFMFDVPVKLYSSHLFVMGCSSRHPISTGWPRRWCSTCPRP
jgi:uncharacterized membrane protein YphA (DoxX/SURF4 family)